MSIADSKDPDTTGFRTSAPHGDVPQLQLPVLQQTFQFIRDPIPLIERGVAECGELFALNILGFGPWVFVCSPVGVEQLVRLPNDVLAGGEVNHQFFSAFFAKDSLFFLDGPQHLERRRLLLSFLREDSAHFVATVERVTRRLVDSWPVGQPFPLLPELREISFQIMMETIFGFEIVQRAAPIVDLLRRVALEVYLSPLLAVPALQVDFGRFSPWGRLKRLHAEMCTMLDFEIQRCRTTGNFRQRHDVLSQLLAHQLDNPGVLTDQALRGELLGLLAAGLNTPGLISGWAIECAWSFPGVLERIRTEVGEVVASAPIDATHLPRLSYLEAVINESIRHRMPSPMAGVRRVKKSASLCGYELPEGALVSMCLAGLGLRQDLFPEPHQFRPDRFLERKYSAFEWNPFGFGSRQCVSKGLGQIILKVMLVHIFTRTHMRLVDTDRRRVRSGMFFVPKHGLRVVLERRR